jgi:hypothetical protein
MQATKRALSCPIRSHICFGPLASSYGLNHQALGQLDRQTPTAVVLFFFRMHLQLFIEEPKWWFTTLQSGQNAAIGVLAC